MWYSAVGCLVTLTLSLLAAPRLATAQPQGTLPRIGVLEPGPSQPPTPCLQVFQQGLRDLGYVEEHTIRLAYRHAEGYVDRLPALLAELVQLAPDVIWLTSTQAVVAAKQATTTIPIVIAVASNLVERGLVASLARPGGNLTGMDFRVADLVAKQLEMLKDAVPTISRVAALHDPTNPFGQETRHTLDRAARALGVQLQHVEAGAPAAFEAAFAAMVDGWADALLIVNAALFADHRQQLLALALRHRLPTVSYGRHFAGAGSLLAAIRQGLHQGQLTPPQGRSRQQMEHVLNKLGRTKWNVHIRERYPHGHGVLVYLARYLRGGPLANRRLRACAGEQVVFRYEKRAKGPGSQATQQTMRLPLAQFIGRWLQHVPPRGACACAVGAVWPHPRRRASPVPAMVGPRADRGTQATGLAAGWRGLG